MAMTEDNISRYQQIKPANDDSTFAPHEKQVIARAAELRKFIEADQTTRDALLRKAQPKFRLFGPAANWTDEQRKQVNDYITLAMFTVAASDIHNKVRAVDYTSKDVITKMLIAMDKVAREKPQSIGR
ncbi:MAG: hypothetical protein ACOYNL_05475 [Rickettsiales bacterium]